MSAARVTRIIKAKPEYGETGGNKDSSPSRTAMLVARSYIGDDSSLGYAAEEGIDGFMKRTI